MDNSSPQDSQQSGSVTPAPAPTPPPAPQPPAAEEPKHPPAPQAAAPQQLVKVGEHRLTDGEMVLFQAIYAAFDNQRQLIAMLMAEKHGYPEKEPVAFEFNWQNKTVIAFRPSAIEVAGAQPPGPAQNKTA